MSCHHHNDNTNTNNSIDTYVPWSTILNINNNQHNNFNNNHVLHSHGPIAPEHRIWNFELNDLFTIFLCAILLFVVRRLLTTYILRPLAIHRWKIEKLEIQRFTESAWFSLYYPLFVLFGLYVLRDATWMYNLDELFYHFPQGHLQDLVDHTGGGGGSSTAASRTPLLKFYSLVGCGFYLQAIVALVFVDERMKDYVEMLVHHASTIVLIFLSVFTMHHRVGSLILILHDVVDIFLYSAKAMHSAKKQTGANILFFAFTVSFLVLRLMLFPYIVYLLAVNPNRLFWPSTHFLFRHVPNVSVPIEFSSYGLCLNRYCISTHHFLNALLLVLVVLHVYWFVLVVKLLVKTLGAGGNVPGDIRHHKKEKKKKQHFSEPAVVVESTKEGDVAVVAGHLKHE